METARATVHFQAVTFIILMSSHTKKSIHYHQLIPTWILTNLGS